MKIKARPETIKKAVTAMELSITRTRGGSLEKKRNIKRLERIKLALLESQKSTRC